MPRLSLSSNAFSTDDQIADALSYLSHKYPDLSNKFVEKFPEYNSLEWSGSWVDTEASGVDVEYMSWVADWIEDNTTIFWEEGEPWDTKG